MTGAHDTHAGHDHARMHSPDLGHVAVTHDGHTDYVRDGHRHAAHGDHWDEH